MSEGRWNIKENMSGSNKSMFLIIRNMGLWIPIKHMFNCTRWGTKLRTLTMYLIVAVPERWPSHLCQALESFLISLMSNIICTDISWCNTVEDLHSKILDMCPPPGVQILSISCSFWKYLAKLYVGAPPWRVGAPSSGKSWIRHCKSIMVMLGRPLFCSSVSFVLGSAKCDYLKLYQRSAIPLKLYLAESYLV